MGKVIRWELCKIFKSDYSNKRYIRNPEFVLKNEAHKVLWDFRKQTDHLISARRPELVIIKKKKKKENQQNSDIYHPGRLQNKIKRKRKER